MPREAYGDMPHGQTIQALLHTPHILCLQLICCLHRELCSLHREFSSLHRRLCVVYVAIALSRDLNAGF